MLEVKNVGFTVGEKWLVKDLSYCFEPGKKYMLCGPNGAGKTTVMKLLGLELQPKQGEVYYNSEKADYKNRKHYAKTRAVLSQQVEIGFPLTVEEVVMMGRYPHFDVNPSGNDLSICNEVIAELNLGLFKKRNFLTLSGGEKQRVQFARVLAQIWERPKEGNRILLLDEPISALDLRYQFDFLHTVDRFMDDRTVVVAILHDFNLVLNYADEVLLMKEGKLFDKGQPSKVLSPENVREVFQINTKLHRTDNADLLWIA